MEKLRIVFMGTPEFAVGILDTIVNNSFDVVGVITAPDKPAGRGKQLKQSAVKEYALAKGLHLLQPTNLKDENFLFKLKSLNANVQVVVAFRMLPEAVWRMPKYGTFNLHASLLPQYRGAAPINWAIINGEEKTGVTTFFIDDKIDTGEVILNDMIEITATENAGELHDKLMFLGQDTVVKTLRLIATGDVKTTKQTDDNLKEAPKLFKENCEINWSLSGKEINDFIRGLSPYPAAWTTLCDGDQKHIIKIYEANRVEEHHDYGIGTILTTKKEIKIAVKNGFIQILKLQMAGKKVMTTSELLNGTTISATATTC